MLLAIDVGNSFIKFGIFDRAELVSRFSIPTVREYTADEIYELVKNNIQTEFAAIVISSVVTQLRDVLQQLSEKGKRS